MSEKTKKYLVHLFVLTILILFNNTIIGQELKLTKRKMMSDEFVKFKNFVGTYKEGKNYNKIINGHGTGLMPPTEEQWEHIEKEQFLIDMIDSPLRKISTPTKVDNSETIWFPPIGNQGHQGSCVSWACAYYTKTFQEAKENNWDLSACIWYGWTPSFPFQDKLFSPFFVYNQLNYGDALNGTTYYDNINLLFEIGCCTWNKMPAIPVDHTKWPDEEAWRQAPLYRSKTGYSSMWVDSDEGIENLKQILANGNLAIFSVNAENYENLTSEDLFTIDNTPIPGSNHANTIVGYDDNYGPYKEDGNTNTYGAFKVANSWGVGGWENVADGFYYLSYKYVKKKAKYIYIFENYIDYKPKMIAVFEMVHSYRDDPVIKIGLGSPAELNYDKPFETKKGGSYPFPNNPIVVDITELQPHLSGLSDKYFLSVNDVGTPTTGIIQYFSIENYDDYRSGIPNSAFVSTETPINSEQDNTVTVNLYPSSESIIIKFPSGGEIFDIGSNPILKYALAGTSGYVNIDYSTDGGETWSNIASNAVGNGEYTEWIIPNTPSENCKIKISDNDGTPSVISKGIFKIRNQQKFTELTSISIPAVKNSSVECGDYDNDGDLDILLTGDAGGGYLISKVYTNEVTGLFSEEKKVELKEIIGSAAWGDYDNDGNLDILLTGSSIDETKPLTKIYHNNGDFTFTEQTSISLTNVMLGSAAWGDYDNDGDLDILLTGLTETLRQVSEIYSNNGNNTFTKQSSINLKGVCYSSAVWGDYDNDSDLDILLTGRTEGGTSVSIIYCNNGDSTFTEKTSIILTGVDAGSVDWGDYDSDGYLDILLAGSSMAKIYHNDGNDKFSQLSSVSLVNVENGSANWGDYDNDGDLDILLTGGMPGIVSKIYTNKGNNEFVEDNSITLSGVGSSSSAEWCDYDNDGDLDIILTGERLYQNILKIYRNENSSPNMLPSTPTQLETVLNGNEVEFSWVKSNDSETPQNGLTYNLVIGTSPGNCDILSPMSDLNTGNRKIVSMGNAGHCSSKTIKGLTYGKYYWSVQAIDNNFSGSSFAATQSFIIQEPQTIILTNPEIGDTLIAGSKPRITYSSIGNSGYINLYYSIDGGISWDTIATNTVDNGEWQNWVVPNSPSSECKIRVSDSDGNPSAESNGFFTIKIPQFSEQVSSSITGLRYSSTSWGDYDNDGDLDILLTGEDEENILVSKIYQNEGNSTFKEQDKISLTGIKMGSGVWGDYDNDGDLDILLTGKTSEEKSLAKIYRNDGNYTFIEYTLLTLDNVRSSSASWGDYDNDGDLDILITNYPYNTQIYQNMGNGIFEDQTTISLIPSLFASWGDYDKDGDLDIIITGDDASVIYSNNGNNTFTQNESIVLIGASLASWGDYNNDVYLDLILTGNGETKLYSNNHNNSFTENTSAIYGVREGSVNLCDFDNDGYPDIILTGYNENENICLTYHNNRDETFTEENLIYNPSVYISSAAQGDFDNDGDLDLALMGNDDSGYISKIYTNNNKIKNTPPSIPSGLKAFVNGNEVNFSWNKSNDNETPQNGLTYNLVIGNSPVDCDILSPMSDLLTGYREIVASGNVNHNTTWTIKNLQIGKYYWSVQAIDNTFAGSKFAENQYFLISSDSCKNISYEFTVPNCDSLQNTFVIDDSSSLEGEIIKFPKYQVPVQHSAYQPYYNLLANAEFCIPRNSLKENIKIIFNFEGMCEDGLIDNPETKDVIEILQIRIQAIGDSSSFENQYKPYYFENGNEASIRIPMANIDYLMNLLNFDKNLLNPFFMNDIYDLDSILIRKEVDSSYYSIYLNHLGSIKLGIIDDPTNINETAVLPSEYCLNQNFPNPFNPRTNISFLLPKSGNVSLKIFNIVGQDIATLVNEKMDVGSFNIDFDASNLNSGIYFYRLVAGKFTETKKMILLK